MRKLTTALIAVSVLATAPSVAFAYDKGGYKEWRKERREARKEWRQDRREARREWREARRDYARDRYYPRSHAYRYSPPAQAYRTYPRGGYYPPANWRTYRNYDYNRYDPRYGGYYAGRYYRSGNYYQPRYLAYNDRIYRGMDGRYYCRRQDGTTGLIIGALAGGALGNALAPGESRQLGTVLGAIAGGLAGRAIDRNDVRCR